MPVLTSRRTVGAGRAVASWAQYRASGPMTSRRTRKNRWYTHQSPRDLKTSQLAGFFAPTCGAFVSLTIDPSEGPLEQRKEEPKMRAVDAIMECLKAEGVDAVFGIPGGANLPTYDALYDAGIRSILCRHEQGAGHAAEGYAKASGRVGVALATSGPGATNLVTPIADAMHDSVPTVFITGQVRTDLIGTDGFQEADVMGITMPVIKHSFQVLDPREIPHMIHEAFHVARSGRPGPVLVDVPQDLSRADIPYDPSEAQKVDLPGYKNFGEGNAKQIRLAAKALANSKRPVIYAGGGVINGEASAELTDLVLTGGFPITCTVMGLGGFPAPHDQWLRLPGQDGPPPPHH